MLEEKTETKVSETVSPAPYIRPEKAPVRVVDNSNKTSSDSVSVKISSSEKNTTICSLCNFEQPSNRKVCWHCGAKFEEEN